MVDCVCRSWVHTQDDRPVGLPPVASSLSTEAPSTRNRNASGGVHSHCCTMAKAKRQSQKSWRKRGAVLEDAALRVRREADQERRTGGSVSKLADSQLFSVDASGGLGGASVSRRKALRSGTAEPKVLHVDRVIATNPYIDAVVRAQTKSAKPSALSRGTLLVKDKIGKARDKLSRSLAHRAARAAALAAAPPEPSANALDIWGAAAPQLATAPVPKVCRRSEARRKPESSVVKGAVAIVPEGASWNPTHEEHQKLLAEATEHELRRQAKEAHHRNEALFGTGDDFEGRVPVPMPPEALREDQAEQSEEEEDEDGDEDAESMDEDDEGTSRNPAEKRPLTAAQRKKRARQKEREAAAEAARLAKRRERDLERVNHIVGQIKREDKVLKKKQQAEAEWEAVRPKKLGPKRYEAKRPDVLLTEELPKNFRNIQPEGNPLIDRMDSLQARNLIEVRQHDGWKPPEKRKRRTVVRETAKDTKWKSPFGAAGPVPAWL